MFVFFVKQKTAYEMRISDWSSDVCSSDLTTAFFYRNPVTNSLFTSVPLTQTPGGPRFTFRTIFPGGFAPDFHATIRDASLVSGLRGRSEEHTSELQSLMRISYAVFCLKKKRTRH